MRSRYSIWLKIGIVVFAAGLIFLCTMVVRDSGEFYAESKDGLWKGYISRSTGRGEGTYQVYVCYLGNEEGNIGEIEVQPFCSKKAKPCRIVAESVPISVSKHFSQGAPKKAYRLAQTAINEADKITLGISWKDKDGEVRYSSLLFSS